MVEHVGTSIYSMLGAESPISSAAAAGYTAPKMPSLVEDPSFSGGYAFESLDPSTGDPSRYAIDWGSLKTVDYSIDPPQYRTGALMFGGAGEILRNLGDFYAPDWSSAGSLYGSSAWEDPEGGGGALSGSLPTYTAPSTPLFSSTPWLGEGMYSTSPAPGSTAPVYHSTITGTFDPTPEEIVAAAAASGTPVPPGVDPVEHSKMLSGVSPSLPPASSTSVPASSTSVPALPPVSVPSTTSGSYEGDLILSPLLTPPTSTTVPSSVGASIGAPSSVGASIGVTGSPDYSAYVESYSDVKTAYETYKASGGTAYPTAADYGKWHWNKYGIPEGRILPSSGVSGSPITAAMRVLSPSLFGGGGGLLCDPITGKCPTYR